MSVPPFTPLIPPLYFVRHGETDWNAEGRLQGQRDIPLNDVGRVQAEETGRILARIEPKFSDLAYWGSPLSRAAETMTILRETLGLHAAGWRPDDRLKELAFGRWEGLTWKEAEARDPRQAAARLADKWGAPPPDGESYVDLAARVRAFMSQLDRPALVVSHGGVGRAFHALVGGMATRQAAEVYIRQGVVYVFDGAGVRIEAKAR